MLRNETYNPPPITERDRLLMATRNIGISTVSDIADHYRIVDHRVGFVADHLRHIHEINATKTARSLGSMLADRVSHKKHIVISNGSSGEVIGITPTKTGCEVRRIQRFGDGGEETVTFSAPTYSVRVLRRESGMEFEIRIQEKEDAEKKVTISSEGPLLPRPFSIATEAEILFARADRAESLSCAREYMGSPAWYISGIKKLPRSHETSS